MMDSVMATITLCASLAARLAALMDMWIIEASIPYQESAKALVGIGRQFALSLRITLNKVPRDGLPVLDGDYLSEMILTIGATNQDPGINCPFRLI